MPRSRLQSRLRVIPPMAHLKGQRIVVAVTVLAASVVLVLLASRLLLVANHVVRVGFWCVKSCAGIVVVGSQYFPSLTRYP